MNKAKKMDTEQECSNIDEKLRIQQWPLQLKCWQKFLDNNNKNNLNQYSLIYLILYLNVFTFH